MLIVFIRPLCFTEKAFASLFGGFLSTVVTIPLDVMVAQFQQASKAGHKVSAMKLISEQVRSGGVSKLVQFSTAGFLARYLHVSLTIFLMRTITSAIYDSYSKVTHPEQPVR